MLLAQHLHAQGGPPMLTDDPGTPGDGNFELNLAATLEHSGGQNFWELPTFDLNYGVGDRIQLNLQPSFVVLDAPGRGPVGGLGAASMAVKWRFFDQGEGGWTISTFPRVERAVPQSSVRRGLADDGTRFFLPVEVAHTFGPLDLDLEVGPLLSTVGRSEWNYGIVAGTVLSPNLNLMAEIHGSARANFSGDRLTLNFGVRQDLSKAASLIASIGHDVRSAAGEPLLLISYLGMQLRF
jgi:hypothetical protein